MITQDAAAIPTSIQTTREPSGRLVSTGAARLHVGVPASGPVGAGLEDLITVAEGLLDGPDSLTGVCWRSRGLRCGFRGAWPEAIWLPGPVPDNPSISYTNSDGAAVTVANVAVFAQNGRQFVTLPMTPNDYGGVLTAAYDTPVRAIPASVATLTLMWVAYMWTTRSVIEQARRGPGQARRGGVGGPLVHPSPIATALLDRVRVRWPDDVAT